jgi:hypothetical protein
MRCKHDLLILMGLKREHGYQQFTRLPKLLSRVEKYDNPLAAEGESVSSTTKTSKIFVSCFLNFNLA